ncbi:DUF4142 domain-containing protein [Massilia haematophila]|uniref:DUF4142 domain-containing protein n=1 Tax=Massilia haematophila TaxID=457923 RepID=A0ABV7PRC9_9BURK|nr:DUF4142 domain-containing protein [Massilia sp.]
MQKNKVLKGLLAVSAVAAMLGAHGVQAQTTSTTPSATELQSQQGQAGQNLAGKSARDGAVDNTNSQGMEDRSGQVGSSTAGQTGSSSSTSSSHGAAHQSGSTSGSAGMSGSTGTGAAGMSSQSSGASGAAGATGSSTLSKADSKGITDMAMVNMAEIEMGKLAQSKSQNQEVKTYAQQMIDDHTKALQEVQTVAQAKGVTLPTELDAKHKAMSAKLEKLSGDAFDREYMKVGGVASHKEAHKLLQKNQKSAKDPEVKGLATKMMPTVEQHLKAAQQMPAAKSGTTSGK